MSRQITFDDVLIEPAYSDIESRDEIDIKSNFMEGPRIPIISAPMDTVSGPKLVVAMAEYNAYGILHRFADQATLTANAIYVNSFNKQFGVSVGVKNQKETFEWMEKLSELKIYPHSVCIDVAHGHHELVWKMIIAIKDCTWGQDFYPYIIAGNVATYDGFSFLQDAGADAIRVGIGGGSACTTRGTTGVGIPQLSAIMDCVRAKNKYTNLIADGGIQTPGDIAKALAAGADAVMLGRMLAGTAESEGEWEIENTATYKPVRKIYRGQSTVGTNGDRKAPEGVSGYVSYEGTVEEKLDSLTNYLKSSFSYVGARNIAEFREKANFIRVSPATYQESRTRI